MKTRALMAILVTAGVALSMPAAWGFLVTETITDEFEDGDSSDWIELNPLGWTESGGEYHATDTSANRAVASVYRHGFDWGDYEVEADVQPLSNRTTAAAGLRFRFRDDYPSSSNCTCDLFRRGTGESFLQLACYGVVNDLIPFGWRAPETIRLKATAVGGTVSCEAVGRAGIKLVASDPRIGRTGTAGLRATHIPADFDNFVVRLLEDTIEVEIDIMPGSDSNSINAGSNGVIPVAILTTDEFDAASVDGMTVTFGPGEAAEAHRRSPMGHLEDVDRDGDIDAVFHFRTREIGLDCDATELSLEGRLRDQTPIMGTDSVAVEGKCE